jgi:hypothetical protein
MAYWSSPFVSDTNGKVCATHALRTANRSALQRSVWDWAGRTTELHCGRPRGEAPGSMRQCPPQFAPTRGGSAATTEARRVLAQTNQKILKAFWNRGCRDRRRSRFHRIRAAAAHFDKAIVLVPKLDGIREVELVPCNHSVGALGSCSVDSLGHRTPYELFVCWVSQDSALHGAPAYTRAA